MDGHDDSYVLRRVGDEILIAGVLGIQHAATFWHDLRAATSALEGRAVLELSQVRSADSGVVALLLGHRAELSARGIAVEIVGANPALEDVIALHLGSAIPEVVTHPKAEGIVAQVGRITLDLLSEVKALLDFIGRLVVAAGVLVRRPKSGDWRGFASLCERAGADAVPIVLLINFLVGFVMAFQSAKQLRVYGANIYVADLVGISITRELAPLMTAIIVCGRSGAAFAAEMATMKINEEVDALHTLGIRPFEWLVVPRVAALMLVVPILTLLADVIGVLGGMVVAVTDLEVTPRGYYNELLTAVLGWDVVTGLIKSASFSLAIALISCQQGMAASGGAEGVGKRTTTSVVVTLFSLVSIDAFFTVVFRLLEV